MPLMRGRYVSAKGDGVVLYAVEGQASKLMTYYLSERNHTAPKALQRVFTASASQTELQTDV